MRTARPIIPAFAVLLLLLLAGCAAPSPDADPGLDPGLDRFTSQELDFTYCDPENPVYECARLEVPLDYDDPDGATLELGVLRAAARGERIGSLVLNPGGPGVSGMEFAAIIDQLSGEGRVAERFDLVGFDTRATGTSEPSAQDCITDAERDRSLLTSTFVFGGAPYTESEVQGIAEQCAESVGGADVLSHLGSRDTVRDMDVLRAALGDEQLTFMGASYGTRLGALYAETFPDRVRALVLDGGIDPLLGTPERLLTQWRNFQRSFDLMAEACAPTPGCALGSDPDAATAAFQSLVRPLIDAPAPTADGRGLDYPAAVEAVFANLYNEAKWADTFAGLAELAQGRGDTLLAIRDGFQQRVEDGTYRPFLEGTLVSQCGDKERATPEQETALREQILEVAPFVDDGLGRSARDVCEFWPSDRGLDYPYATDIEPGVSSLVVAITGDPAAPYDGNVSLVEQLGGSLLTVEGEQHGVVFTAGNACVEDTVADYLIDLTEPADDARCTL